MRDGVDKKRGAPEPNAEDDLRNQPLYPPLDATGYADLAQIDAMLRLTPAQLEQLCGYLEFVELARQARIKRCLYDPADCLDDLKFDGKEH